MGLIDVFLTFPVLVRADLFKNPFFRKDQSQELEPGDLPLQGGTVVAYHHYSAFNCLFRDLGVFFRLF